jgi:hypothetical protein
MGAKKRRRAEFFKIHPYCCFCGGREKATEEDHVPARAIFDERKWPEGYAFPACEFCNRLTRQDEKVVAFLSRMRLPNDKEPTPIQLKEWMHCADAIQRTYPEAYRSIAPSANEVRQFLKRHGIQRPPGTSLADIPIAKIGRPEFVRPIRNFGIKLLCALHYKHVGSIVQQAAKIGIRFLTNVQVDSALDEQIFRILPGRPTMVRTKTELDDQFHYIFGIASDSITSAYVCRFRASFALTGIVSSSPLPKEFDEDPSSGKFKGRPFNSQTS